MAKRGNSEGSIYKRKDGRWAASVSVGWHDGKYRRKTLYGKTRREGGWPRSWLRPFGTKTWDYLGYLSGSLYHNT